jgi:transcriptional regulator with XRE-family HTH domain
MNFGKGLRVMRAVRNVSQIELVVMAGVNKDYLSKTETGQFILDDEAQKRIRVALDWPESTDELLERVFSAKWEEK